MEVIEAGRCGPSRRNAQSGAIQLWGREIGPVAVAATAGAAAGVAAVAIARAARTERRPPRRGSSAAGRRWSPAAASWSTSTSSGASRACPLAMVIEERVLPRWPYRLPRSSGGDGVIRVRGRRDRAAAPRRRQPGAGEDGAPGRATSTCGRSRSIRRGSSIRSPSPGVATRGEGPAREAELGIAVERMRFAIAVEDDMGDFFRAFKRDPLIGPGIHHMPWVRPKRRPWPWEALCWAITKQLIESSRAAEIQRRIVRRWAPSYLPARPSSRRGAAATPGPCGTSPRRR